MTVARVGARQAPEPDSGMLNVPTDSSAPGVARRYVHHLLRDQMVGDRDLVDVAVLLTSELVTNAVMHGRAPVAVHVRRHATGVRIEVRDAGDSFPAAPSSRFSDSAEGGRGLLLLMALASAWGSTAHDLPGGKTVWFELADPILAVAPG